MPGTEQDGPACFRAEPENTVPFGTGPLPRVKNNFAGLGDSFDFGGTRIGTDKSRQAVRPFLETLEKRNPIDEVVIVKTFQRMFRQREVLDSQSHQTNRRICRGHAQQGFATADPSDEAAFANRCAIFNARSEHGRRAGPDNPHRPRFVENERMVTPDAVRSSDR